MEKIGIFGGTFDPVHWGHLLIAESALSQIKLDRVIWVTTPNPHYKQAVPFEHRLEMVQMAIADHPGFTIFPVLENMGGGEATPPFFRNQCQVSTRSYAIQTLFSLQAAYPNTDWYWILGLDTFQTLPRWYRLFEIATACNWIVAPRDSVVQQAIAQVQFTCEQVVQQLETQLYSIRWQILDLPMVGVSSSLVRQRCRSNHSIRYLVPEPVRTYIASHNLYSDG